MTVQQAIEEFKKRLEIHDYEKQIPEYCEAMRMAINALENQIAIIPDKVVNVFGEKEYTCKECGNEIERSILYDYCPSCGRKIDWSGVD